MLRRLFSKFVLNKADITEKFSSGSGPGGQSVNKAVNCAYLKHLPTGIHVKVHDSRDLNENRKIALKRLTEKVEYHLYGESSKIGRRINKEKKRKIKARKRSEAKYNQSEESEVVDESIE